MFFKSFFIQTLLNKESMQSEGYSFLTDGQFKNFINSNPYFCTIIAGLSSNFKREDERMSYIASISAMVGDNLFWNNLRPVVLLAALFAVLLNAWYVLPILFVIYNALTFYLRFFGFSYGVKKSTSLNLLYKERLFTLSLKLLQNLKHLISGAVCAYFILNIYKYLQNSLLHVIITCFLLILIIAMKRKALPFVLLVLTIIYFIGVFK